ncbi:hypothetical protein L1049_017012 [Liquidambar formosana]|uniref:SWIM-type domain-containing protein n=1 Tax=Liquidambar formosana TaxID=63359 RepID=A0AAP0S2H5_LIQFO
MHCSDNEMLLNVNEEGVDEELKVGMKVYSEDESFKLCNSYALKKGFSIRRGNKRMVGGQIRQRDYVCSKQGFREFDDLYGEKKVNRLVTRTGCKALIRFTVEDGVWEISHFNPSHNHEFATLEERQHLRSGRSVPNSRGNVIKSMVDVGIPPTKTYSYLAKAAGGTENVGFTKKDCLNYLQRKNDEMIEGGDGQSLIDHFKYRQAEDPNFFYTVQVDQFNRMTNFFWRDGQSKLDYDCFGDVVVFDTTFCTNKYNLVCGPFVGANHHWKNVLFGCAFLLDETTESFVWLFETFLQSMGNRQPKTIFTDEDKAMANAIAIVFPQSRHRLCTWHISKNANKHLVGLNKNSDFKVQFNQCFYDCHSEMEFEAKWKDMIKNFDLVNHPWLNKLYSLQTKWCPVFSLDTFSANMRSTQRSESTNNVFNQISKRTMNLISFVHQYETKTKEMRSAELEEDFRCKFGVPHPSVESGMLIHAANVYTIKMYKAFEKEFVGCMGVRLEEIGNDKGLDIYEAKEESHERVYVVQFDSLTCMISCSCKLFESLGMLCRHTLKVLDLKNFTSIPTQYILKRWTKEAKKGVVRSLSDSLDKNGESSESLRFNEMMHEGSDVFNKAKKAESFTKIVKEKLMEAVELIEREMEAVNMVGYCNKVNNQFIHDNSIDEPPVLNPPCVRTKGTTNVRLKSIMEKRKRKPPKVPSTSQTSKHNRMVSGKHRQTISGDPPRPPLQAIHNQTIFHPSLHQSSVPCGPNLYNQENLAHLSFGHPNFSFTSMMQGSEQLPCLSQDLSVSTSPNYQIGQLSHLNEGFYFYGLDNCNKNEINNNRVELNSNNHMIERQQQ